MKVTVYSHNYMVSDYGKQGYHFLMEFAYANFTELDDREMRIARFKTGKSTPIIKRIHAAMTQDRREMRFHRNTLDAFKTALTERGLIDVVKMEEVPVYTPSKREVRINPTYSPFDYQIPYIKYVVAPGRAKLLNLGTGMGKTATSLFAASEISGRMLITLETRFFNLWVEAFEGKKAVVNCNYKEQVLFISGSKDLRMLQQMALNDALDDIIAIIISSRTLCNYYEAYEKFNGDIEVIYPIPNPSEFFEILDIALRIKDEVHLSLASNFYEELHLHCPKSVSLSATLEDGTYRDKLLGMMFPMKERADEAMIDKYIDVTALMYGLHDPDNVKYTRRGSTDYSHNAYEQYILRYRKRTDAYYEIIKLWLQTSYLAKRVDDQRACIFFDSIEMVEVMHKRLVKDFPNLTISRYAASTGDVYKEARMANVMVTTVKSFGTGFDLDDLLCTLMTNAIKAKNTNVQVLGRLRKLKKYPDTTPTFHYLVCSDVLKHIEYHKAKMEQYDNKARTYNIEYIKHKV